MVGMDKRTLKRKYKYIKISDIARDKEHQLLSYTNNASDIYYDYEKKEEEDEEDDIIVESHKESSSTHKKVIDPIQNPALIVIPDLVVRIAWRIRWRF